MTVEMAPRRTEYIPLDHLTPDSSNPKAHDLEIIDASVGRFGMIDQIVRDDRTGKIISGHGRHMALVSMRNRGETPPEGVRVDAGGHWLVPVVVGWSSRTDAEARAALIALNQTTILGGWVDDSLLDLLDNLSDFTGVGFDEDDLDDLRARLGDLESEDLSPDLETPERVETTKERSVKDLPNVKDLVTIHYGDCLDVMREIPDASVDAIVTDPPYGLGFMGKAWDDLPPGEEWARECLRVLKPGGHLLAFGGSRTWHRLAVAVEDAGFEIRDSIAWLHGQGFPKGKAVLKPAFEPVVVSRKPLDGTVAANVLAHGTGALNIDGCRVSVSDADRESWKRLEGFNNTPRTTGTTYANGVVGDADDRSGFDASGRWPANVVLDETQAAELDKQSGFLRPGERPATAGITRPKEGSGVSLGGGWSGNLERELREVVDTGGGASRFFPTFRYEAKAPTSERPREGDIAHPTVKPLDLMRWLVRLVTPPGGVVLDPFAGSGTTLEASVLEGFPCIGIEREADYLPLIRQRLGLSEEPETVE